MPENLAPRGSGWGHRGTVYLDSNPRRLSRRKTKKRERGAQTGTSRTVLSPPGPQRSRNPKSVPPEDKGAPEGVAARPQREGPAAEPAQPGCPDGRGPCLPPHDPPAGSCSPCSRSAPRSPPSARPKATASAPKPGFSSMATCLPGTYAPTHSAHLSHCQLPLLPCRGSTVCE